MYKRTSERQNFIACQILSTEMFGRVYEETECLLGHPRVAWRCKQNDAKKGKGLSIRESHQPHFAQVEDKG